MTFSTTESSVSFPSSSNTDAQSKPENLPEQESPKEIQPDSNSIPEVTCNPPF